MTILSIAQDCSKRLQITSPSSFIGSTDNNQILLRASIEEAVTDIALEFPWPELQKEYVFTIYDGVESYALPPDFDRFQNETLWNRTQKWPLIGPVDSVQWQQYKSGLITSLPRQRYRVKGWTPTQFFVDPVPTSTENAQLVALEYMSNILYSPLAWAATTAMGLNSYRSANGQVYKCTTAGTTASLSPNMVNGVSNDNTTQWTVVSAWVTAILYRAGEYVNANSKVYKCSVSGVTSGVAPSHTSGTATDGTVTWTWVATPSAWVAGTSYTADSSYVSANSKFYRCTLTGKSGAVMQNFTLTTITDGTAVWTWQSTYNSLVADTDDVILYNQMIVDGATWRWKRERGLDYEVLMAAAEQQKELAKTRLSAAGVQTINSRSSPSQMISILNYPEGSYGL